MNIVFFGTPLFAAKVLEYLLETGSEIVGIVTRPDKPKGRSKRLQPSVVKEFSLEKCPQIPLFQPEKASTDAFAKELQSLKPDVFVVVAYGEIIKANILEIPTKMCVNVHPSLLPKYRGAAPIQSALFNGDQETGVTIMEMVLAMDAGDILEVVKIPLPENITFGELEKILYDLSGPALVRVLEKITLNAVKKIPQDPEQVTFSKKIVAEDRVIDWIKSAKELHNQIRALSPRPGAYCFVEMGGVSKRLVIRKSEKVFDLKGKPGETLVFDKDRWVVGCANGALSLLEIQLEGKKAMPIKEFLRGASFAPLIKI
ncbi:MAG: methionyl-tRNA formyltransferase [Simkaniaceae bacterium]|nr:methionyl-tRNA formyltransferase [Candidatus Sacchlamyda saccharinae]